MERIEIALPGARLHALQHGPQAGSPVLCIPGLSANAHSFDALAVKLAASGRRVVAVDLRGRGRSPAGGVGSHGWRRHAEDLLAAADALGFRAFDLVGHSMGAFVAMQAAALGQDRVRRLVLIDGAGRPEAAVVAPILAGLERLETIHPSADEYAAMIRLQGAAVPWAELWERHYREELERVPGGVRPRTSKAAVLEDVRYGATHDPRAFWPALRMPTLLLRATWPLLPGTGFVVGAALRDEFAAEVPSARVVEVPANHYGVMAEPSGLAAIEQFLA
ncbi:MAG TPA: alpha/beta fold hydrolase [Myxococcales bacterium]|jgi:pimeloyl-ACP methyl ester carboxylesterase